MLKPHFNKSIKQISFFSFYKCYEKLSLLDKFCKNSAELKLNYIWKMLADLINQNRINNILDEQSALILSLAEMLPHTTSQNSC